MTAGVAAEGTAAAVKTATVEAATAEATAVEAATAETAATVAAATAATRENHGASAAQHDRGAYQQSGGKQKFPTHDCFSLLQKKPEILAQGIILRRQVLDRVEINGYPSQRPADALR